MDLVIHQMVQLQIMHVPDRDRAVKILARPSVTKPYLAVTRDRNPFPYGPAVLVLIKVLHYILSYTVFIFFTEFFKVFRIDIIICHLQGILDISLVRSCEYRRRYVEAKCLCRET